MPSAGERLARDTRLDRLVAVKVLPSVFADDPTLRARFEREARAISALNHPHICTLHDVGDDATTAYLVMEYVKGEPPAGPMPASRALSIAMQSAMRSTRRTVSASSIVDLKPSNILLPRKSGAVRLLDFGLASQTAQDSGQGGPRGARCDNDGRLDRRPHDRRHAPVHGAGADRAA